MTSTQKIIKYCAIAFALFLAVSIIGGIVSAVASLSFISGGKHDVGDMNTYAISMIWKSILQLRSWKLFREINSR